MHGIKKSVISIVLIVICSLIIFFSLSITAESIPSFGPILSRGFMSTSGPDWECHCPAPIIEWDCICKYNN